MEWRLPSTIQDELAGADSGHEWQGSLCTRIKPQPVAHWELSRPELARFCGCPVATRRLGRKPKAIRAPITGRGGPERRWVGQAREPPGEGGGHITATKARTVASLSRERGVGGLAATDC